MKKPLVIIPETMFSQKWGLINFPLEIKRNKQWKSPFSSPDKDFQLTITKKIKDIRFADEFFKLLDINSDLTINAKDVQNLNIEIHPTKKHYFKFDHFDYLPAKSININSNRINFTISPHISTSMFGTDDMPADEQMPLEEANFNCKELNFYCWKQNNLKKISISSPTNELKELRIQSRNNPSLNTIDLSSIKRFSNIWISNTHEELGTKTVEKDTTLIFDENAKISLGSIVTLTTGYSFSVSDFNNNDVVDKYKKENNPNMEFALKDVIQPVDGKIIVTPSQLSKPLKNFVMNKVFTPQAAIQKLYWWNRGSFSKQADEIELNPNLQQQYEQYVAQKDQEEAARIAAIKKQEEEQKAAQALAAKLAQEEYEKKFSIWFKSLNPAQQTLVNICKSTDHMSMIHAAYNKNNSYINQWNQIKTTQDCKEYVEKFLEDVVQAEIDSWRGNEAREDGSIGLVRCATESSKKELFAELDKNKIPKSR